MVNILSRFHNKLVKSANLKYCYESLIDFKETSDPVAQLKMQGGVTDSNIWPWMYEIRGSRGEDEEDFFCSANQIRLNLLVTGKIFPSDPCSTLPHTVSLDKSMI